MSVTLNGTSGLVFGDGTIQGTAAGNSFRNRIINGDMRIDQRNAGASTSEGGNYTLDRWANFSTQSSKFTTQRNAGSVTPPPDFVNYLGFTSTSAYTVLSTDTFGVNQPIEGINVADFAWGTANAQTAAVSFWVRSSIAGTHSGAIGNSNDTRGYPFSYTITSANTWEYKTITVPGDTTGTWATDNTASIKIKFNLGTGANRLGTAGTWVSADRVGATGSVSIVGTSGATFYVTGVQFEKAAAATSFEHRPIGTELALCQRYYENSYPVGAAAGSTQVSSPQGGTFMWATRSDGWYGSMQSGSTQFKVPKRSSPGLRYWDFAGNLSRVGVLYGSANFVVNGGSPVSGSSTNGFYADVNTVANSTVFIYWEANAEL